MNKRFEAREWLQRANRAWVATSLRPAEPLKTGQSSHAGPTEPKSPVPASARPFAEHADLTLCIDQPANKIASRLTHC